MVRVKWKNRKARSARQIYAIKKNYARKFSKRDTDIIWRHILGVPGMAIIFFFLFLATGSGIFLIGTIILAVLEGVQVYQAIINKSKKIHRLRFNNRSYPILFFTALKSRLNSGLPKIL